MKWHKIPGIAGYEITSNGKLRSWLDKGRNRRLKEPRLKKVTPHSSGGYVNIKGRCYRVGHLLALTFVGPPPLKQSQVIFIDGNRQNIAIKNLAWHVLSQKKLDAVVEAAILSRLSKKRKEIIADLVKELRGRKK